MGRKRDKRAVWVGWRCSVCLKETAEGDTEGKKVEMLMEGGREQKRITVETPDMVSWQTGGRSEGRKTDSAE